MSSGASKIALHKWYHRCSIWRTVCKSAKYYFNEKFEYCGLCSALRAVQSNYQGTESMPSPENTLTTSFFLCNPEEWKCGPQNPSCRTNRQTRFYMSHLKCYRTVWKSCLKNNRNRLWTRLEALCACSEGNQCTWGFDEL